MFPWKVMPLFNRVERTRDRVEEDGVLKLIPNMDYRGAEAAAAYACKIQESFEYLRTSEKLVIKPVIVEKK